MPRYEPEIKIEEEGAKEGKLVIGPLERGMGQTLGNGLRRTMLSYLPGAAVTEVRIEGVPHEFSPLEGVKEDVIEILLNLKKVNFKMDSLKPLIVTLEAKGVGEITAGDLHCPTGVKVLNEDQIIASLTDKKAALEMEMKVEFGRGYRLVDKQKSKVGVILLDADYSPVRRVAYRVEPARVGRVSGLDQIVFEIDTDGSISPHEALQEAAAVLEEHASLIKEGQEVRRVWEEEQQRKKAPVEEPSRTVYLEELNLPTRVLNALRENAGMQTVREVRAVDREDLLEVKNIGPKSADQILDAIENLEDA